MSRNPILAILADVRPAITFGAGDRHKTGPCDYCRPKCLDGSADGNAIRMRARISLVEPRGFEPLTSAVRLRRSPN
jgi:hypothetical protein